MITLYKKGDSHTLVRNGNSIKCRAQKFKVKHLQAALKAGWSNDPENLVSKPGRKSPDPLPSENKAVSRGVPDANKD